LMIEKVFSVMGCVHKHWLEGGGGLIAAAFRPAKALTGPSCSRSTI
jgi:hypothetical protein